MLEIGRSGKGRIELTSSVIPNVRYASKYTKKKSASLINSGLLGTRKRVALVCRCANPIVRMM